MHKFKKRLKYIFTFFLISVLAFSTVNSSLFVDAETGTDKTDVLEPEIMLLQDNVELSESDVIDSTKDLVVKIDFSIPVIGDEPSPTNPVLQGDYAFFDLGSDFSLLNEGLLELTYGGVKVGEVNLVNNTSTNHVEAQVNFNGDVSVYDGTYNSVIAGFSATLRYDGNEQGPSDENYDVTIINKTFSVNVPAAEKTYNLSKSGTVDLDNKVINWTINASVEQLNQYISLEGYSIADDLSNVGELVENSFKVNDVLVANSVNAAGVLNYIFSKDDGGQAVITFQTKITDEEYYSQTTHTKTNSVNLNDTETTVVKSATSSVSFKPQWITKSGSSSDANVAVYDPIGRTVTWTIIANDNAVNLQNVVIKDALSTGLTLNTATWSKWDSSSSSWINTTAITPNSNAEYALGNIDTKIMLRIVANVPDPTGLGFVTGATNYTNTATIYWTGNDSGITSNSASVNVGYNAISKSGVADTTNGTVTWTVNVNTKGQEVPDLKVYDLLIFGSQNINMSQATGLPAGVNYSDLTQRTNQRYIEGSLTSSSVNVIVHPIYINGTQVGELLEFTGLSVTESNSYTFKTQITNPDIYAGNRSINVYNTASLFSGNEKLNAATGRVTYTSRILSKSLINFNYQDNLSQGLSHVTTDATKGFNYLDKSIVYYLDVNRNAMDLTNMLDSSGTSLGNISVSDILPEGWTFIPVVDGQMYQLYEVDSSNNYTLVNDLSFVTSDFTNQLGQATFDFSQLDKHYVILVKATADEDTLKEYFEGTETTTITNNLTLTATNHVFSPTVTVSQNVQIVSDVLSKDYNLQQAGELEWIVDYKTYNLDLKGIKIEDTLPQGIELKKDSNGSLVIDDNIAAYKLILNADGSYSLGDQIVLVEGENVLYNSTDRTLTFMIEDSTCSYRFTYKTDITGDAGTISNSVKLYSDSELEVDTQKAYSITQQDEYASFQKSGWVEVTKVNQDNSPLAGVEFTLYTTDGTILRQGSTDSNGKIRFKVLPTGDYTLKETSTISGYSVEDIAHTVSVVKDGDATVAYIDGKTGANSNLLTVKNYSVDNYGSLTLTKYVTGDGVNSDQDFEFTIKLDNQNEYDYYLNDVYSGTLSSGDNVSLKAGDVLSIPGIEQGTSYEVTEADYNGIGLMHESENATGTIVAGQVANVVYTNSKIPTGTLTISKNVTGVQGDLEKTFDFTINFKDCNRTFAYTGDGVADGTVTNGSQFSLASGQSITITDLPENLEYEVIENDYTSDLYTTTSNNAIGVIVADENIDVVYTNSRIPTGTLTISKDVTGNGGDLEKTFDFTLYLKDCTDTFEYIGEGVEDGTISDGSQFSLASGQSITILNIPENLEYEVVEKDYTDDLYNTTSENATGKIVVNENIDVAYTNSKIQVGTLTISKEVIGIGANLEKPFDFTIYFKDCTRTFKYNGDGIEDGIIRNGSEFSLAAGQSITILNIPEDTEYEVVEKDYTDDLYKSSSVNASGLIEADNNINVVYTNTKIQVGTLTISKKVTGNQGDLEKLFDFTIYFEDCNRTFEFTGDGVEEGTISDGSHFSLASGQSITILGIPEGIKYEVVENDYSGDGYTTTSLNSFGEIIGLQSIIVEFTNDNNVDVQDDSANDQQDTALLDTGDNNNSLGLNILLLVSSISILFISLKKYI